MQRFLAHKPGSMSYSPTVILHAVLIKYIYIYIYIRYCAKRMQTNFSAFRNFSTKFNESSSVTKVWSNFQNGYCFNKKKNSCCSSKAALKFELKISESRNKFSRAVSQRIECSSENLL